jgi:hypothetical protein
MSEIVIAGNVISVFPAAHLQMVYRGNDGSESEIEVQAPPSIFLGYWTFPKHRPHNTSEYTP